MKKLDWTLRFFLYGFALCLVAIILLAWTGKVNASTVVPYANNGGNADQYTGEFTVNDGDIVVVNGVAGDFRSGVDCLNSNFTLNLDFYRSSTGATTTVQRTGYTGSNGVSCSLNTQYNFTATGTETIQFASIKTSNPDFVSIRALVINQEGGGGGTDDCNDDLGTHIGTDCVLYVENPVQNLYNGLILILLVAFGIIWFFKRPKT